MILAFLAAVTAPITLPAKLNETVQVGEHRYRVVVKGRQVRVVQKALVTYEDPERGLEMKEAVRIVTGCKVVEEFWRTSAMIGLLDCKP